MPIACALLFVAFALIIVLLIKSRRANAKFEKILEEKMLDIQRQASLVNAIFDSSSDHIFCKDLNLRYTHCNKSASLFFNVEAEDVIGKTDTEAFSLPPKMAEAFLHADEKVINEKRTIIFEEKIKSQLGDGEELIVETMKTPLIYDGKPIGILGIARDITKRKSIEEDLQLQTSTLTTLFDSIPDLIFTKDLRLRYLQCNKSFLEHFGLNKEDVIGKSETDILDMSPEEAEESRGLDQQVMFEGKTIIREGYGAPRADGTIPIVEQVKTPLMFNGIAIGVLCITRDITKFKDMEERALAASRSKSAFLATMSHEIRTPMNSIIGFSELALDCKISPKVKHYLTNIQKNSEWLLQIINDILDISKVEAGRMTLDNVPFDLNDLFASCKTIIMPEAAEKDISLHFYAEPITGKSLLGDPTRLRQVFINLLSNAIKFTDTGSVEVLARVKKRAGEKIVIYFEVKDSGIGITEDQIKRIFVPFMQAETGTTRKYGGTGLGLPITKTIIEMMGSRLLVKSKPGVGSTFSFELTFDTIEASDDQILRSKAIFKDFKKPIFEGEVLVCEDNAMNQQVICEHLARVGLKAVIAENGKEAVETVKSRMQDPGNKKQFNLIFMDIHMPVMDGLEAAAKIIALAPCIPIVAMTANIMSDDMEVYQNSGMSDYVGKPFTSQELWFCLLKHFTPVKWQSGLESQDTQVESDLRHSLIRDFVKDNRNKCTEIADAIAAGDINLAHRMAHNLKSNAGHLGRIRLQSVAAAIEQHLCTPAAGDMLIGESMQALQTELSVTLSQLAAELGTDFAHRSKQEPPLDPDAARELLGTLEPLLKTGNPECLKLINDIRRIPGSNEELVQHIENFDFEQAFAAFSKLKA